MKFRDLTGQTFGRLTAVKRAPNKPGYGQARWVFNCTCGRSVVLFGYVVCRGAQVSCGCYHRENPPNLRHGKTRTRAHQVWVSMRGRCYNKSHPAFSDYGGRGIQVCSRWSRFENFLADMGDPPAGRTLDRINNEGPYTPKNCRWASRVQQVRNRRVSNWCTYLGERKSLPDWCDFFGLPYRTVWHRFNLGERGARLFRPIRKMSPRRLRTGLPLNSVQPIKK